MQKYLQSAFVEQIVHMLFLWGYDSCQFVFHDFLFYWSQLSEEKKNLTASLETTQADADFAKRQLDQAKCKLASYVYLPVLFCCDVVLVYDFL